MAIIVQTADPKGLIAALKAEIKKKAAHTWVHETHPPEPKDFFTHTGEGNRFLHLAWFAPLVADKRVVFALFSPAGQPVEYGVWGVYHGRFLELLLNHGGALVAGVQVTPGPFGGDVKRKPKHKATASAPRPKAQKDLLEGTKLSELLKKYGQSK